MSLRSVIRHLPSFAQLYTSLTSFGRGSKRSSSSRRSIRLFFRIARLWRRLHHFSVVRGLPTPIHGLCLRLLLIFLLQGWHRIVHDSGAAQVVHFVLDHFGQD